MPKKKKEENIFKGNEVMMMLENMNDGIQVIAEGHQTLLEGQKKLKQEIQEFRAEVDQKFDTVFEFLSNIEDEMVSLRKEINILKENKANNEDVINLDNRLSVLEEKFEVMQKTS